MTLTLDGGMVALCSTAVAGGRKESRKKQREKANARKASNLYDPNQQLTLGGFFTPASSASSCVVTAFSICSAGQTQPPQPLACQLLFVSAAPALSLGFHKKTRKVRWGLRQGKGTKIAAASVGATGKHAPKKKVKEKGWCATSTCRA